MSTIKVNRIENTATTDGGIDIDSSGNVGVGTAAPSQKLHVENTSGVGGLLIEGSNLAQIILSDNNGGTNDKNVVLRNSQQNLLFGTQDDSFSSFSESLRLDSSGRLLVGTTTEGHQDADNLTIADSSKAGITIRNTTATGDGAIFFSDGDSGGAGEYAGYIEYGHSSNHLRFATNAAERMRLSSTGQLFLGTGGGSLPSSSVPGFAVTTNAGVCLVMQATSDAGTNTMNKFINPNGDVGSIKTSGSSTSFNTSSDYRLKENVVDIADGIIRVKQLSPRRFNFIADGTKIVDGFIAHEAQAVVPEAVTGEKDGEEMQGIDQAKLVPLLTAALQEAISKIETLETQHATLLARVTALEAA